MTNAINMLIKSGVLANAVVLVAVLVGGLWLWRRAERRALAEMAARMLRTDGPAVHAACFKCGADLFGLSLLPRHGVYFCRCGTGYTRDST